MPWQNLQEDIAEEFGITALSRDDRAHLCVGWRPLPMSYWDKKDVETSDQWASERRAEPARRAMAKSQHGARRRYNYKSVAVPVRGTCDGCGELYERPSSAGKPARFCSKRCAQRVWKFENRERARELNRASRLRAKARRPPAPPKPKCLLRCGYCQRKFARRNGGRVPRFCGDSCRNGALRRKRLGAPTSMIVARKCPHCEAAFSTPNYSKVFCSRRCKDGSR